ncbi:uncharacterized protein LOC110459265 isoform X2 [Mizuhopecten yessoensis]|uniref:C-type lectin domain-containing protein n=1 Tax=Mizuhopecten yessoensis TaxID=6573 RepID=A0A210Q534_MIZYE|nr:uncharacterized protein LOC110459265 isoform X2 [Mizuhopecten yessoensis]OWF43799.1 hypothetical protein KP79_PYT12610 [Mizuhopecten yessoensis]
MYLHHIIVWVAYYSVLVKCDVITVKYEKTWDAAVHYCKTKHNGTLSSVKEIGNSSYTGWENVWTLSQTLTKWLSFIGCFYLANKDTKMTFYPDYDVTKRCSEGCDTSRFIGISAKRRCVCLSEQEQEMIPNKMEWEDCHPPKNESHYIVYRKYDANVSAVVLKNDLSDSTLNCGAVSCKRNNQAKYFYPEDCTKKLRFICAQRSSRHNLNWTNGIQHCLKNNRSPQSFGNHCQKADRTLRSIAKYWIGMYRPLDHDNKPYKECTYWSNDAESANCSRGLPFFCTGHPPTPPTQSPMHPTSTNMSGDRKDRDGHRNRPDIKVLIGVVSALAVLLLSVIVVGIILWRRIKQNAKHITLQKQHSAQEQNTQVQMKMNLYSQERKNDEENLYEFEEIDGENEKDNQSMPCRNFTVKCPLPPEVMRSASQASGNGVSSPCNLPVFGRPKSLGNRCSGAETARPCHHVSNSPGKVDDHYDFLNSPRPRNEVVSDTYDHARIVNAIRGVPQVIMSDPDSLPSDVDVQQPSKMDDKDGVYDFAKGVENEYDEFETPTKHVVTTDTYDHVSLNIPS